MTILKKVQENIEDLKVMSFEELNKWSLRKGINSRSGFSYFKKALFECGIDYDQLKFKRDLENIEKIRSKVTHEITFYSDANAKYEKFAVTDKEGDPVWYGRFFHEDYDFKGHQASAELSAAKKAVFLASKVAENIQGNISLKLYVDAEWLTFMDGKVSWKLWHQAKKLNVDLHVIWVKSAENLADPYTRDEDYKNWKENDFSTMATPLN